MSNMKIELTALPSDGGSSWLDGSNVANFVSILSLIVGIGAGIVAWLAWRTTSRHNANEHVHRLFSEYLKARLDHRADASKDESNEVTDIAGMKLYILEEMYNWVLIQSNLQNKLGIFQRKVIREAINDNIESWKRTIIVHVLQDFEKTKGSIIDYASCYSVNFIKFVAFQTNDQDLVGLASVHDLVLKNRQPRPLGPREKILLHATSAQSADVKANEAA